MRKLFCTSSIFAGMVALLWSGFYFKHAATVWWMRNGGFPNQQTYLTLWLFMQIVAPLCFVAVGAMGSYPLWKLSEFLCSKLRANTKAEPLPQKEKV